MVEWDLYETLRDKCGFSHWMIHTVSRAYFDTPRMRRVLHKAKPKMLDDVREEVEHLALMCMRETGGEAGSAIMALVWPDRDQPPAVCWTTARAVADLVSEAMKHDRQEADRCRGRLRPLKRWEERKAMNRWKNDYLRTYLVSKQLLGPRAL